MPDVAELAVANGLAKGNHALVGWPAVLANPVAILVGAIVGARVVHTLGNRLVTGWAANRAGVIVTEGIRRIEHRLAIWCGEGKHRRQVEVLRKLVADSAAVAFGVVVGYQRHRLLGWAQHVEVVLIGRAAEQTAA